MSYDSRLEGTLALHPFPDGEEALALREALAPLASPGRGRLALTPLGHGLVVEATLEWTEAIEAVEHARTALFAPRGIALSGVLEAIGEDDARLATITFDAAGTRVEHHEQDEDDGDDGEDEDDEDEQE